MFQCHSYIAPHQLLEVLEEVETEIRNNGTNKKEQAMLYHQLGSIYGLMGDSSQQTFAWRQAQQLDPENEIILSSLKSLSN
ncbi:MAG: hypothetical protein NTX82_02475 [Candidatus Parcubacteria bacterium]|nr:hypothetical protein [Candidatus Parcubacteria bacterium]